MADKEYLKDLTTLEINPITGLTDLPSPLKVVESANMQIQPREEIGTIFGPYGGVKPVDVNVQFEGLSDIPEARAQSQSGWKLLGNAFAQGATEAVLGAVEGVGYVLDFEELFNADEQSTEGFDNWFSKGIREAKEYVQEEAFPVYQTQRAMEGSLWERMGDATFWASQGKTIGTTLSLLVPSAGVARVAGLAGKAARLGTVGTEVMQGVSAAMFSRKAESAMEANQAFQQEYQKYLNEVNPATGVNYTDTEARQLAGESAATVFKANAAMLPLDMLQYTMLLKSFKGLKGDIDAVKATKLGKAGSALTQVGSEALEEGYQFVAQEEAIRKAREGITPFGEGFGERLAEYVEDPEFQTSAFLGGLMGGVFGAVGPVARKVAAVNDNIVAQRLASSNLGDIDSFNKIDNKVQGRLIVKGLVSDKLDLVRQNIDELEEQLTEDKYTPEEIQETKAKLNKFRENIDYVQNADEVLKNLDTKFAENPSARKEYALLKWEDKLNTERINELNSQENKLLDEFVDEKDNAVYSHRQIEQLENTIKDLKSKRVSKSKQALKQQYIDAYQRNLDALKQDTEELVNSIKEKDPSFDVTSYSSPNIEQLLDVSDKLSKAEAYRDRELRPQMAQFERMSPEEMAKEEAKIQERTKENTEQVIKEAEKADRAEAKRISDEATQEVRTKLDDTKDIDALELMKGEVNSSTTMSEPNKKRVLKQIQDKINNIKEKQAADKVKQSKQPTEEVTEPITEETAGGVITLEDIQKAQTSESKEEVELDSPITRQDGGTTSQLEANEVTIEDPFDKKTTKTNIAYLAIKHSGRKSVTQEGNLQFIKDAEHRTALPQYFNPNDEIVLFIDANNAEYEANKDNAESIPIGIMLASEFDPNNPQPKMWLHKLDWVKEENVAEKYIDQIKEETKNLREYLFKNQKPFKSFIIDKTPGYANRSGNYSTVRETISDDTRPQIGIGKINETIEGVTVPLINNKFMPGIPYIALPTATGEYFALWLRQEGIKNNPNQDMYNNTVIALMEAYVNGEVKDIRNIKQLRQEIGKYYYVNRGRLTDEVSSRIKKNIKDLFHINENEDGEFRIQLIDESIKGKWFRDYRYTKENGWERATTDNANKLVWQKTDINKVFKSQLSDKYPNITNDGIKAGKDFEVYELQDGKLTKVKKDYIDFLSDNRVVTSRIQGYNVEGQRTYFAQSNIGINTDVSKLKPLESEQPVNPKPVDSNTIENTEEEVKSIEIKTSPHIAKRKINIPEPSKENIEKTKDAAKELNTLYTSNPIQILKGDTSFFIEKDETVNLTNYSEYYKNTIIPLNVFLDYEAVSNAVHLPVLKFKSEINNGDGSYTFKGELKLKDNTDLYTHVKVTIKGSLLEAFLKASKEAEIARDEYSKTGFKDINEAMRGVDASKLIRFTGLNRALNEGLSELLEKNTQESLEVSEKSINFEDLTLDKLFPEGLPSDINLEEIFNEQDKQEADKIMKECQGGKFGRN